MRIIGLLGGMSYHSTLPYYQIINETVAAARGGHSSARILLNNMDFQAIVDCQDRGDLPAVGRLLGQAAYALKLAGAESIAIASNTMHYFANDITAAAQLPLLHIGDATAQHAKAVGTMKLALLGTLFTMEKAFLKQRLQEQGLTIVIPESLDRRRIHECIFQKLVKGVVDEETCSFFADVAQRLAKQAGVDAIILGCTEIGLALKPAPDLPPLFDTTRLHAEAIAHWSLAT